MVSLCISVVNNHSRFWMSKGSISSSCSLRYTRHWPKVGVIMGAYVAELLTLTTSGQLQNKPLELFTVALWNYGGWKTIDKPQPWLKPDLKLECMRNTFPIYSVRCISSISSDNNVQARWKKYVFACSAHLMDIYTSFQVTHIRTSMHLPTGTTLTSTWKDSATEAQLYESYISYWLSTMH